jgi:hypothetical protein
MTGQGHEPQGPSEVPSYLTPWNLEIEYQSAERKARTGKLIIRDACGGWVATVERPAAEKIVACVNGAMASWREVAQAAAVLMAGGEYTNPPYAVRTARALVAEAQKPPEEAR